MFFPLAFWKRKGKGTREGKHLLNPSYVLWGYAASCPPHAGGSGAAGMTIPTCQETGAWTGKYLVLGHSTRGVDGRARIRIQVWPPCPPPDHRAPRLSGFPFAFPWPSRLINFCNCLSDYFGFISFSSFLPLVNKSRGLPSFSGWFFFSDAPRLGLFSVISWLQASLFLW